MVAENSMGKEDSRIVITNNTLRVEGQVYPIRNICMFGPGEQLKYPWARPAIVLPAAGVCGGAFILTLIATLLASQFGSSMTFFAVICWLLFLGLLAGFVYLIYLIMKRPVWPGLRFTLSSGGTKFFRTRDESGVQNVSDWVTKLLEGAEVDERASIVVNRNSVTIDRSTISGPVAGGDSFIDRDRAEHE